MNVNLELVLDSTISCHPTGPWTCREVTKGIGLYVDQLRIYVDEEHVAGLIDSLLELRPPGDPPVYCWRVWFPDGRAILVDDNTVEGAQKEAMEATGQTAVKSIERLSRAEAEKPAASVICEECGEAFSFSSRSPHICKKDADKPENPAAESAEAERLAKERCSQCEDEDGCECKTYHVGRMCPVFQPKPYGAPENPPDESAEAAAREVDGTPPCTQSICSEANPSRWIEYFKTEYLFTREAIEAVDNSDALDEPLKKIHATIMEDMEYFVRMLTICFDRLVQTGGPTHQTDFGPVTLKDHEAALDGMGGPTSEDD